MKWFLYVSLGLLALILLFSGFYFYNIEKSKNFSDFNFVLRPIAWNKYDSEIKSDCKPQTFADTKSKIDYLSKLFKEVGIVITYDSVKNQFTASQNTPIDFQVINPPGGGDCYIVWTGNADGVGTVVYETTSGSLKKLQVSGYPYTK